VTHITFALIREGTSDEGLVPHIRSLIVAAGADSVLGAARDYTGTTVARITRVLAEESPVDMIFVHRDADSRDHVPRQAEVTAAAAPHVGWEHRIVPVVPVQELEAWLLADELAIRTVVGKPSGRASLGLPAIRNIESTASPKEVLESACVMASETTGARRASTLKSFPRYRSILLERLDPSGNVSQLPSWQRFVDTVQAAAREFLDEALEEERIALAGVHLPLAN
jgi:hypothetical protein